MELMEVGRSAGIRLDAVNHNRIVIGRHQDCDVVVSDQTVSRRHAALERQGEQWRIRDLGSRNGVFVNGIRIRRATPVTSGDSIQLGDTQLRLAPATGDSRPDLATARPAPDISPQPLSPRERQVLAQVAAGLTDEQVAQSLTVSVKTVRSHLDRIRDKTGARRRPDLTRCAMELGLI